MVGFNFLSSGGTNIPYATDHQDIANGWTVKDLTWNHKLTLKHLQTGSNAFSPYAPMNMFTPHMTYTTSVWMWTSEGDPDVFMTIIGPGNDGYTYSVEFGRNMGNEVWISGWNTTFTWAAGSSEGYRGVQVSNR